jgi:hypothetical protein
MIANQPETVWFGNIIVYPPRAARRRGSRPAPDELDPDQRIERIVEIMVGHGADDLDGVIIVIEPTRVRTRRGSG